MTACRQQLEQIKSDIVNVGRDLVQSGLVVGTWGNISARVPGGSEFVITPSGMDYMTITPQDLVVVNLAGEVVEGIRPSSEVHLHLSVYRQKAEANAVIHTHSIFATAHAVTGTAIPVSVEDLAMINGGEVVVAPYGAPGTEELANKAVTAMGKNWAVLLANHGMVGMGRSLKEALLVCQLVEKSAQINHLALSLGQPSVLPASDVQELRRKYLESYSRQ